MIKFVTCEADKYTYEGYESSAERWKKNFHRIYLTLDYVGASSSVTLEMLGLTPCYKHSGLLHYTSKEVEEHLNMATLRVVELFLETDG